MSLLTHLLIADLRRVRLIVVLWVSALLVETAVEQISSFFPAVSRGAMTLQFAGGLLAIATALLSWALVPFVLQLHPAVGTTAFWTTRPIPPRTLVAAKLVLLLAVFVGVPLAIEQVVMAIHTVPSGDMARVGIQTALNRGVLMAVLAVPAVLTPNLARFALLCGAALFAFALLPLALMSIDALFDDQETPRFFVTMTASTGIDVLHPRMDPTPQVAAFVLFLFFGVLAMTVQYARRRIRDSVAVVIAGLLLTGLITANWPSPVMHASSGGVPWAQAADVLILRATPSSARYNPPESGHHAEPRWVAQIPLTITPPPPGWLATVGVTSARVDVGGEVLSTKNEYAPGAVLPDSSGELHGPPALRRVLGVERLLEWGMLNSPKQIAGLSLLISPEVVVRATTAQVGAEFIVDVTRLDIASARALGLGYFQDGAYAFTIQDVRQTPSGVLVHARTTRVATSFDRHVRPFYWYFLRNKRLGEAVRGMPGGGAHSIAFAAGFYFSGPPTLFGGFSVDAETIAFDGRDPTTPHAEMILTPEWLTDAEFVIVRATHQGSVRRTVEISDFPLQR